MSYMPTSHAVADEHTDGHADVHTDEHTDKRADTRPVCRTHVSGL
jgi:hypothetical protein